MPRTITLKYTATCKECGSRLHPGDRARYYGTYKIYGTDCHDKNRTVQAQEHGPDVQRALRAQSRGNYGLAASIMDPRGVYSSDGTFLGTAGPRCEDAPCCGCCS